MGTYDCSFGGTRGFGSGSLRKVRVLVNEFLHLGHLCFILGELFTARDDVVEVLCESIG